MRHPQQQPHQMAHLLINFHFRSIRTQLILLKWFQFRESDFGLISSFFSEFCLSAAYSTTSRIKTVRAGELDFPQENQAQQASTDFRVETGLSIVFICCCRMCRPPEWAASLCNPLRSFFQVFIFLPLKNAVFTFHFFSPFEWESPLSLILKTPIFLSSQKWYFCASFFSPIRVISPSQFFF